MTRYKTTNRIFDLIANLQTARQTITELSQDFEVSEKTLSRDLQFLESKLIVFSEQTQSGKKYRINPAFSIA